MYDVDALPTHRVTPQTLRDILARVIEEYTANAMQGLAAGDLEPLDLLKLSGSGPRKDLIIQHELRVSTVMLRESEMCAHLSQRQAEGHVRVHIMHALKSLQSEQGGCDWRMVAAVAKRADQSSAVEVEYAGPKVLHENDPAIHNSHDPTELRQRTTHVQVKVPVIHLTMVFADVAGATLTDPNTHGGGDNPGEMSKYCESRRYGDMPTGMRNNRQLAEVIIRQVHGAPEQGTDPRKVAPPRAVLPPVPPNEPHPSKDEGLRLMAEGLAPAAVAKRLGVAVDVVKSWS
jgi:hypothetical protein